MTGPVSGERRPGGMGGSPGPRPGDPAPGFRLRHTFDEDVELAGLLARGPVVLAFYVFDFGST